MAIVTLSAAGRITPDEVWERYADLSLWSQWAPQIRRVEATSERLEFGTTGRVYGPPGVRIDFVVLGVDADARRWAWTVTRWPVTLRLEHAVTKRGGGSATSLRIEGPLPVVLAYAPIARFALQRLVSKKDPVTTQPPAADQAPSTDPDGSPPESLAQDIAE